MQSGVSLVEGMVRVQIGKSRSLQYPERWVLGDSCTAMLFSRMRHSKLREGGRGSLTIMCTAPAAGWVAICCRVMFHERTIDG